MAKALPTKIVDTAKLSSYTIDCIPKHYNTTETSDPCMVRVSATFLCYNDKGAIIATYMSKATENAEVPYFILADNLETEPTWQEIMVLFRQNTDTFRAWCKAQIKNLADVDV